MCSVLAANRRTHQALFPRPKTCSTLNKMQGVHLVQGQFQKCSCYKERSVHSIIQQSKSTTICALFYDSPLDIHHMPTVNLASMMLISETAMVRVSSGEHLLCQTKGFTLMCAIMNWWAIQFDSAVTILSLIPSDSSANLVSCCILSNWDNLFLVVCSSSIPFIYSCSSEHCALCTHQPSA